MKRLWDKDLPVDNLILKYTVGNDFHLDERLVEYDIQASIAHASMLKEKGLIKKADYHKISKALKKIGKDHKNGEWKIDLEQEDCHTAIENHLTKYLGSAGGSIHLGRSRNDQVLAALRLYLKDVGDNVAKELELLISKINVLIKKQGEVQLPGYTHTQRGMPSSVKLWAEGYTSELSDDVIGIKLATNRADKNPLGSAAGYGTPGLNIDRELTTKSLGFKSTHEPVTAVQISRGKAEASVIFEITIILGDLAKLASDIILFYSDEFSFLDIKKNITTGSSIMPQKNNPDVFELVRSAESIGIASLVETLSISSKLISGYHRDLQRIKMPLFRSIDIAIDTIKIMTHSIENISFNEKNIILNPDIYATEQANKLALEKNISFREAYKMVAKKIDEK